MSNNSKISLSQEEINELIKSVKDGNQAAWQKLYQQFEEYVHSRCWKAMREAKLNDDNGLEEALSSSGWIGFLNAIQSFDPEKGQFLTYATYYIDGEIHKEIDLNLNVLGVSGRKKKNGKNKKFYRASIEEDSLTENIVKQKTSDFSGFDSSGIEEETKFDAVSRTIQVIEILRLFSDERHTVSKEKLKELLTDYREFKFHINAHKEETVTMNATINSILENLNPTSYTGDNDSLYKIKYKGYDRPAKKGKYAPRITDLWYVHPFSYEELDQLFQLISYTSSISLEDKINLMEKLSKTTSSYYKTPFWDGFKAKFNAKAIHNRLTDKNKSAKEPKESLGSKVKLLQYAINHMYKVTFDFDMYNANHELVHKSDCKHNLSPYHIVVYHDNYYCIGLKEDGHKIWHYRVDLMSNVKILYDNGKPVKCDVCKPDCHPLSAGHWNPAKYMAEHLYMAYDDLDKNTPRDILIKIRNTDYTILQDWFNDYYTKTDRPCEAGYDIVKVKTSPTMIVHWALQYGTNVEILDEEVRTILKEKIEEIKKLYD